MKKNQRKSSGRTHRAGHCSAPSLAESFKDAANGLSAAKLSLATPGADDGRTLRLCLAQAITALLTASPALSTLGTMVASDGLSIAGLDLLTGDLGSAHDELASAQEAVSGAQPYVTDEQEAGKAAPLRVAFRTWLGHLDTLLALVGRAATLPRANKRQGRTKASVCDAKAARLHVGFETGMFAIAALAYAAVLVAQAERVSRPTDVTESALFAGPLVFFAVGLAHELSRPDTDPAFLSSLRSAAGACSECDAVAACAHLDRALAVVSQSAKAELLYLFRSLLQPGADPNAGTPVSRKTLSA